MYRDVSNRPIPKIIDLDAAGLMTIGWDNKMLLPENYFAIPSSKVAIDSSIEIEDLRFRQRSSRNLSKSTN